MLRADGRRAETTDDRTDSCEETGERASPFVLIPQLRARNRARDAGRYMYTYVCVYYS